MTRKLSTRIKVSYSYGDNKRCDICTVKLDKNKFPYIIINHSRFTLSSSISPRVVYIDFGMTPVTLEILEGQNELEECLSNVNLTIDKLSPKQIVRVV